MSKVALITGVTGQDGSYLAEFLLEKGFLDAVVPRAKMKAVLAHILRLHSGHPQSDGPTPPGSNGCAAS